MALERAHIAISLLPLAALVALGCQSTGSSAPRSTAAATPAPPAAPPPPDPRTYTATVHFDVGSADLSEAGARELRAFASKMRSHPKLQVRVEGYGESVAPEKDDRWLGEWRAKSVASYLVAQGIAIDHVTVHGAQAEPGSASGAGSDRRVDVSVR